MAVKRIRDLKIKDRGLLTAIFGHVNDEEYFVDSDLRQYSLSQQLFLYLKEEGFTCVVFYDGSDNYHSFSQEDLARFQNIGEADSRNKRQIHHIRRAIRGPLGTKRLEAKRSTNIQETNDAEIQLPTIQVVSRLGEANRFFRTETNIGLLEDLKRCLSPDNSERVAVVFRRPETARFDIADKYIELFGKLNEVQRLVRSPHRVLVVFNSPNAQALWKQMQDAPSGLFAHSTIQAKFFNHEQDVASVISHSTYQVSLPDQTEIHNWLNRERIVNGVSIPKSIPTELAVLRLTQERRKICDMGRMDLPKFLERIDTTSAWDQLRKLRGIDGIVSQVTRIIRNLQQGRATNRKLRPHMCFKGNPGTGKTVIAGFISEILKEEGLLSLGHVVKANPTKMISDHIGGTRIKTQALCDEARGGVLFIDEAYGLLDTSDNGFGKEAVEVLIQFMENDPDSLVILAGYPDDIDSLLQKSNPGFVRRFVPSHHLLFEDYPPSVLYAIAVDSLADFELTEEFKDGLQQLITKSFERRAKGWGNAGWVETLVQEIIEEANSRHSEVPLVRGPLTFEDLPAKYRRIVSPVAANGLMNSSAWTRLESEFIGLEKMKATLRDILNSIKTDKLRRERSGASAKAPRLNFIFRGSSGTGKTEVARMLGEILFDYGLLNDPAVIECRREDVIGEYLGQTAPKVKRRFTDAIGKVLFIDEAYAICNGSQDIYGKEAIDAIVGNLTDPSYEGKMAIIMAGYPDQMDEFMSLNPGMARRFNVFVDFDNYTDEELWEIYRLKVRHEGLRVRDGCRPLAVSWFSAFPRNDHFMNAGLAVQLLGLTKSALDRRIQSIPNDQITDDLLHTISEVDFPNYQA